MARPKKNEDVHRLSMIFPVSLWNQLVKFASTNALTATDLLIKGVRLYMLLQKHRDAGSQIIIRNSDNEETELIWL